MLARTHSYTLLGLEACEVTIEVDIHPGLPTFTIVGMADVAVREARDRVRAAIRNCGFKFPGMRITANMAPGDLPKAGAGLDLALACGVLAASRQLPERLLKDVVLFAELSLDGRLRACRGTLAVAQALMRSDRKRLIVAPEAGGEALLAAEQKVCVADDLADTVRMLRGAVPRARSGVTAQPREAGPAGAVCAHEPGEPDLAEVRGQEHAVEALVIAAAGGHNLLLSGAPGAGKTMLAQRLPGILPPLEAGEALEVTRIHSIAGDLRQPERLMTRRPFRAPHHTASTAGLIGGAGAGWVGEVVLAHHGVLFLDELSEFSRSAVEALRQPLEDGRVAIVRAGHAAVYPARFQLIAATNPCPCGLGGQVVRCRCSDGDLARHRRKLSFALLDRIDLLVNMAPPRRGSLAERGATSSAQARKRVLQARAIQLERFAGSGRSTNSQMDASMLRRHVRLDTRGEQLLDQATCAGMISGRGSMRTLRLARTIADLAGRQPVIADDVAIALALRPSFSEQFGGPLAPTQMYAAGAGS